MPKEPNDKNSATDINARDINGNTPLINATLSGDVDKVKTLIGQGAEVNARASDGATPLIMATTHSEPAIIKALLNNGADINVKNNYGETALLKAIIHRNINNVRTLINNDANLTSTNNEGNTPLIKAVEADNVDIAQLLIDKGADINVRNNYGDNALSFAITNSNLDMVKILTKATDVNFKNNEGNTPLIKAAGLGNSDIIKQLIEAGADINAKNNYGETALIVVCGSNIDVVNVLINAGANVNARANDGRTPLMIAATAGNLDIVNALLAKGAKVNTKTHYGETALTFAVTSNSLDAVNLLINKGADINVRNNDGSTPLIKAVEASNVDIVKLLIDKGADVNLKNSNDQTALSIAKSNRHPQLIKLLKQKNATSENQQPLSSLVASVLAILLLVAIFIGYKQFFPSKPNSPTTTVSITPTPITRTLAKELDPLQQRQIVETAARIEGFSQAERDGIITSNQRIQAQEKEMERLKSLGITSDLDSLKQLVQQTAISAPSSPNIVSRFVGWFTFMRIIATIVSFAFIGSLLYLFGDFVIHMFEILVLIPKIFYETLVYGASLAALFGAGMLNTSHQNIEIVCFLGALGFAGSILFSKWLRGWNQNRETEYFTLLTIMFAIGAAINMSAGVAFLTAITFVSALGFMAGTIPFGYFVGFKDDEALGRTTSAGILTVALFVIATATNSFINPKLELFRFGLLWIGSFVAGLGLLIASSRYYCNDRKRWWLFNGLNIVFGLGCLLFGSVYDIGTIQKIGGTFFVLYLIDRYIDLPLETFRQWAIATLFVSGSIIGFVYYFNDHVERLRPYLFF